MSAVGYCRISEQDQSNNSLDNQLQRIKEYCANNNVELEKIFIENGKSAFTFDRPEWLKLEAYIKKSKTVKYLIVHHIDRFSRAKLMDALIKLNEIENKLKIKVLSVSDPLNVDTKDFSVELLRTLNLMFSNNERNRIQDRVKDGVYRSLASGRYCNMAPIGYKNSQVDGKPLLVIDEPKAKMIRKIFKLFIEGMGIEEIRRELMKDGFKNRGNSAIQSILRNPTYAGIINLPPYKGQPAREVAAIHEPIISQQLYYLVQNKFYKKGIVVQRSEDVWLRGILICECGRKLTAGNSKGRNAYYWYYKCPEHKQNFAAKKLHDQFNEILKIISFSTSDIDYFKTNLQAAIENHQSNKGGAIMRNKLELEKVKKKISNTQERYLLNQDIEPEIYAKVMANLKADQMRLEIDIEAQSRDTSAMREVMNKLLPQLNNISEIFENWPLHQRQLFITTSFGKNIVYKDGIYRTAFLHPIFADKALILKEKRLIEIDKTLLKDAELAACTPGGNSIEPLFEMLNVFTA